MKYYVTFKVDARYVTEVDAESVDIAKTKATDSFCKADFGDVEEIDGDVLSVEDKDGNRLWEKD